MSQDLLFELGCEELPSGSVLPLANSFKQNLETELNKAGLKYDKADIYATPRRIAILIKSLQEKQEDKMVARKGPAYKAAYDDKGEPTKALIGFARSCSVDIEKLSTVKTEKGDWVVYEYHEEGKYTSEFIASLIETSLKTLPIPKPMRWGSSDIEFIRPVHWALLLLGEKVIQAEILGLKTGSKTRGHRFHAPDEIRITSPSSYEKDLEKAYVVADFALRKEMILNQVKQMAEESKADAVIPEDLLEEVCSIVEWPHALKVGFSEKFLQVPAEALIASMQSHQKCFALKDKQDRLLPYFITVSNIEPNDSRDIIKGNEKVMCARLSDAAFFFDTDKHQPLDAYQPMTEKVIFEKRLGSLADKSRRVEKLLKQWKNNFQLDERLAGRAARLSKCDLMTGMVGEFPELQGLMGYYYALNDKEDKSVALAINEQYMPRFSGDMLPETTLGTALSLADRMDTLTGIFAISGKPSGVKDPYKLRRHALAIARMLIKTTVKTQLTTLIEESLHLFYDRLKWNKELVSDIKRFILDRAQSHFIGQGFTNDVIQSVLACEDECLYDVEQRLYALKTFIALPEAFSLSAACKRVNNILSGADIEEKKVSEALLMEESEKRLYQSLNNLKKELNSDYTKGDYQSVLVKLARIKDTVDEFFDNVMVMDENIDLKNNRLSLLEELQSILMGVADISMLHVSAVLE